MCHYNHLTLVEREKIMYFKAKNYSISKIAGLLDRDRSTISRELKRNTRNGFYQPASAQLSYVERRKACRPHKRLDDPQLFEYVREKFLEQQWSPEEIAGRLYLEKHTTVISYSTIYREIYAGRSDDPENPGNRSAIRKLRRRGKKRHGKNHVENRGKIRISNDICDRTPGAQNRSRRGHWEADTVAGKKGRACIVTLVDRKTRFLVGGKAYASRAAEVNIVILRSLDGHPVKSITPHRGKEFAGHEVT